LMQKKGFITPGFIDIHSDYIEKVAAPRPNSLMDFHLSLLEAERELMIHGVTTIFHSLSFFNTDIFNSNPIRNVENTRKFIQLIDETSEQNHLIRHRFHARFEIDSINRVDEFKNYLEKGMIHLLSFMDHTPGQGQYRDMEIYRETLKSWRNYTDSEVDTIVKESTSCEKVSLETIRDFAALASRKGIALASHDDDSVEKLQLVQSFGTTISEFPVSMEVARAAHSMGLYTVAGAPNVLRGSSHSGNLSAYEAIQDGCINILCSDYFPASLVHAIFKLVDNDYQKLPEMVRLLTLNPARAVLMDNLTGSLEKGKKADLLIINQLEDNFPVITSVFVNGKNTCQTAYRHN
jgi:alpha-D-ribose 1-methylphosphonate 5-triphosphate diphosphatase